MRIGYISFCRFYPDMPDGGSRSTFQLLRFLGERGHETYTISILPDSSLARDLLASHCRPSSPGRDGNGIRRYESANEGVRHIWGHVSDRCTPEQAASQLYRLTRECGLEVAVLADDDLPAILSAVALDVPSAHFIRSAANVESLAKVAPFYHRIMSRRHTFAVSRYIQALAAAKLGLQVQVWHPWIDLSRYRVGARRARQYAVGYVSAGGSKGDAVVNRLALRMPDVRFVVAGGRYKPPGDRPSHNLTSLGQLSDMKEFYALIDVLLVPSLVHDAFPRVTLEAAASGIPVIGNRVGGIPETLGNSGILVDIDLAKPDMPRVVDQYRVALDRLLRDNEYYLLERGRSLARAAGFATEQERVSIEHLTEVAGVPGTAQRRLGPKETASTT